MIQLKFNLPEVDLLYKIAGDISFQVVFSMKKYRQHIQILDVLQLEIQILLLLLIAKNLHQYHVLIMILLQEMISDLYQLDLNRPENMNKFINRLKYTKRFCLFIYISS